MAKVTTTDEWIDASVEHLKKLTEPEDKYEFIHRMIFNLALCGGYNDYEMVGILECCKADLMDSLKNAAMDCDGDCDNCDRDDD